MKKISILMIVLVFLISCSQQAQESKKKIVLQEPIPQGIWVTVFSKEKVLYSKYAVEKLITFCKNHEISEIYLQIYRAGEPYFDSPIMKKDEYQKMTQEMGQDPLDYILARAHQNGLKVYAWVNVLSLAQNKRAPILKKYSQSVLTRDRNYRASIRTEEINDSDKFYLRDDQLFLEPGDEQVVGFTLEVFNDLMVRYPSFDGVHLDYIRYPYPVPFIPDSRFMDYGVSYGFGEESLARFKKIFEVNPAKDNPFDHDLHMKWDQWKRDQVTHLVERISSLIKLKAKTWKISCAVVPGIERAYAVACQDWVLWLEKNFVDYVVLMNYTRDRRLFSELTKASLSLQDRKKIYLGLGIFLLKDQTEFNGYYEMSQHLNPGGIVFFAYDELLGFYKN